MDTNTKKVIYGKEILPKANEVLAPTSGGPAPVVPTPTDPLNNVRRYTGTQNDGRQNYGGDYSKFSDAKAGSTFSPNPVNEETIRSKTLGEMQGTIDAINNVYAGMVAGEKAAGEVRLGKTRATAARSGTLGSDFGNADLGVTAELNADRVQALEDEKMLKISLAMNNIEDRVSEKIRLAKEDAFKTREEALAYNTKINDQSKEDIKMLAKSGVDLNALSQEEYNKLIETSGYTDTQLKSAFVLNRPEQTILDKKAIGNKYYQIVKDPITQKITSETIDLGFTVPEGYTPTKMADGTLLFTPKQIDPNQPLDTQILMYGNEGQFVKPSTTTPFKSGEVVFTGKQISDFSDQLEKSKGTNGYVDPKVYEQAYQAWVNTKALAKDFLTKYPPSKYVDPANTTLPAYLRSSKAKTSSGRELPQG